MQILPNTTCSFWPIICITHNLILVFLCRGQYRRLSDFVYNTKKMYSVNAFATSHRDNSNRYWILYYQCNTQLRSISTKHYILDRPQHRPMTIIIISFAYYWYISFDWHCLARTRMLHSYFASSKSYLRK